MHSVEPQVVVVALTATSSIGLGLSEWQLTARRPGDLVTAEILFVIPRDGSSE